MKRLFITLLAFYVLTSVTYATENISDKKDFPKQNISNIKHHKENPFEKRLGLTDEQKIKARELRIKGHEKLRPIMDEIKSKKQEAKMVKMSRIAVQMQEEKLDKIDAELKVLEKKANQIRKANMKEFESILTREQKKILKEMKKEGRKRYHAEHPCQRPLIAPQRLK